ncbi:uncharacterized protein BJ171DRAFT_173080 [Polychytrium aggregatum]|uniref:uncharacterized protein n=1 Tax=Polychytrium aggregatum TaxID=110093 RepID=UPI0022FEDE3F|nr:uncharacterized protein BJ171DRAFT_173080 [Polychytrium aggregatum]KAI9209006.1 hypothetical protein BJ171DRAFT_173080 [Polychytrium aggregatum]
MTKGNLCWLCRRPVVTKGPTTHNPTRNPTHNPTHNPARCLSLISLQGAGDGQCIRKEEHSSRPRRPSPFRTTYLALEWFPRSDTEGVREWGGEHSDWASPRGDPDRSRGSRVSRAPGGRSNRAPGAMENSDGDGCWRQSSSVAAGVLARKASRRLHPLTRSPTADNPPGLDDGHQAALVGRWWWWWCWLWWVVGDGWMMDG